MAATSQEDIAKLRKMTAGEMAECVVLRDELHLDCAGNEIPVGFRERPIIGASSPGEGLGAGKMAWPHGFHLRYVALDPGARSNHHVRDEEEVILLQKGELTLHFDEGDVVIGPGDVFTVPVGKARSFSNGSSELTEAYIVRGGDHPSPPRLLE